MLLAKVVASEGIPCRCSNGGEPEDTLLFDPKLLESLDTVEGIAVELPATELPLRVRPLSSGDYDRGKYMHPSVASSRWP
ncbi:hypothetical protein HPB52_012133 [Rhipicephalus sanguineus]|uniref:Uncharacterized protein n=1 Tax=Rhipicephalus sanguineus TaxID=34632 RepID=A0A9D4Q9M7_RHISA|nr:hypothetical protein HPB52_012133 [Rhipicephalus sanguineus]